MDYAIEELLARLLDGHRFRPVVESDLTESSRIFQVRLCAEALDGRLKPEGRAALLQVLRGWGTKQVRVVQPYDPAPKRAWFADHLPAEVSGRYSLTLNEICPPRIARVDGERIAAAFYVSPREVACPSCGCRARFWPPDGMREHIERCHPGLGVTVGQLARDQLDRPRAAQPA